MVRLLVATGAGWELLLRFVLLRAWQRKMLRLRYRYRAPQPAGHRLPTGAIANLRGKSGMVLARVYVDHRESIAL